MFFYAPANPRIYLVLLGQRAVHCFSVCLVKA
jgi:hypothetical protein